MFTLYSITPVDVVAMAFKRGYRQQRLAQLGTGGVRGNPLELADLAGLCAVVDKHSGSGKQLARYFALSFGVRSNAIQMCPWPHGASVEQRSAARCGGNDDITGCYRCVRIPRMFDVATVRKCSFESGVGTLV